jgi:hypothetical protein
MRPCKDKVEESNRQKRDRERRDGNVARETETGVRLPQAKECQKPPELEGTKSILPGASEGYRLAHTLILDF